MANSTRFFDSFFSSRLISHAGFWALTVFLLAYHGSLFGGTFPDNLTNMLSILPVQMIAAYLLIYVQIPKLLFKGKHLLFLLSLMMSAYVLSVLSRLCIIHIAEPLMGYDGLSESMWEVISDPVYLGKVYTVSVYIPALLLFLIKMTKERFTQQNELIKLEKEKRTTELNFLKAQMNPHFLFNTLNNIYALSKNNSELTSEMILKFSDILDYTIYECAEKDVPVLKEWQLIENYADLQALRQNSQLLISIDQQIDDENMRIAPLILISLVENAFKHTLNRSQKEPNIMIDLNVKNGLLTFKVYNSLSDKIKPKISNKKGIGVQNIRRQLALQYPGRHTLAIEDGQHFYNVVLTIQLQKELP